MPRKIRTKRGGQDARNKQQPAKKKPAGATRQDRFARQAKAEGYAARSVYKLAEIDRRFRLFRPGLHVLDLGCHPGGWLKYAAEQVGKSGQVAGIDRRPTTPPKSNVSTFEADLTQSLEKLQLPSPFDVVLSDMAPDTTGIRHVDQDRSAILGEIALQMAETLGKQGSALVVKIFQGPHFDDYLQRVRQAYARVRCVRPEATRKKSIEVYVVALDKRKALPAPDSTED